MVRAAPTPDNFLDKEIEPIWKFTTTVELNMQDTPPPLPSGGTSPPSSAAEQARIRKERREAKIKAGGSARLNKITGLGGGLQRDPPSQPAPSSTSDHTADPEEVDISEHYYQPAPSRRPNVLSQNEFPSSTAKKATDDRIRDMMLGYPSGGADNTNIPQSNPFASMPLGEAPDADDPIMQMLQQMMGGIPGEGGGGIPSFPGMPGLSLPDQQGSQLPDPYAYLWRIVHAIFALGLGLYIAFATTFTGTKLEREMSALSHSTGRGSGLDANSTRFFYIFATFEVLLQTSRFFLEKGRFQSTGLIGMAMGFLPEPWKGYLAVGLRYSRIWTTVSGDAMVCVFVLGVCSWLRT